jgi:hypothetical protein
MDEKGFVLGSSDRTRLVVRSGHRQIDRQRKTAGTRDFMSLVEVVSIRGHRLSPLVIFKAKRVAIEWTEGKISQGKFFFRLQPSY